MMRRPRDSGEESGTHLVVGTIVLTRTARALTDSLLDGAGDETPPTSLHP